MPPNTYTWTCPACRYQLVSTSPSAPDNCPRCNYPDAKADANDDLEADEGPEQALDPAAPATNANAQWQPVHQIDWGWLQECFEAAFRGQTTWKPPPDTEGLVATVRERYEAPRPTMMCGCLAGRHPNTFAAMEQAHPDRTLGS